MILSLDALHALLPMHLLLDPDGTIVSAGRTIRKIIGPARWIGDCLTIERPVCRDLRDGWPRMLAGCRILLRPLSAPEVPLRGQATAMSGGLLLNLGFGIALVDAIRRFSLTDADFVPSDLAMEFLFLHEANRAVMTELARANNRLEEAREAAQTLALTDPLTGLLNRRGFESCLDEAVRQAAIHPFALAHMDLDHFKQVNDRLGHQAGDDVLQQVAQILRVETRSSDRVARMGGDEFLILLSGNGSPDDLQLLGRRIIHRISATVEIDNLCCGVSASLGFARSSDYPSPCAETMLADADAALYAVKVSGRGDASLHERPGVRA
ncbi:MAG: GGDEF domain-containing protein [Paracoccus sp. (in: a-proteobacteria)]|uniref:GGDEF domain-containing protein n=1 Tax=Paracoccus sp. TaxID=267 RepID=UPI0039E5BFF3